MHVYGKIGGFSFAVALFLQFITAAVVSSYLQQTEGNHKETKFSIELHHLIVSSNAILAISCLISRTFFQEQIHQVKCFLFYIYTFWQLHILIMFGFKSDCLEVLSSWSCSSIWFGNKCFLPPTVFFIRMVLLDYVSISNFSLHI